MCVYVCNLSTQVQQCLCLVSLPKYCLHPHRNLLVYTVFPIWIVWKSLTLLLPCLNACVCVRKRECVCEKESEKENLVFCEFVSEKERMYGVCVSFCKPSVVWPVLCLLLSVQTICSFSLKPTRSMRVICQVKYCSFLLFHLTLLHWGYDNISAMSCQHPSGHHCSCSCFEWSFQNDWLTVIF